MTTTTTTSAATTTGMFVKATDGEELRVLGTRMTVKASAEDTGGKYEVVLSQAAEGVDTVPHRHPWEELYVVLDGAMDVSVGGRQMLATAGDFVTIPANAVHSFRVVTEYARFLHVSFGPGAVAAFRDYDAAVPAAPQLDDLGSVMAINDRHGIEVVLPDGFLESMLGASHAG